MLELHKFIHLMFSTAWMIVTVLVFASESCCQISCHLPNENINGYFSQPGDIVIGGTFTIHLDRTPINIQFTSKPPELQCQRFAIEYYKSMHALIFAVEEINADPELLPNVTLGFHIVDTCRTLKRAAQGTLSMLSGGRQIIPNFHYNEGARLAGVIGDSGSTRSILMAQILGLYRYPQVSYFSTNPTLSNRDLFPSFFRTIPSDEFQMKGLAQLVSHFRWSWVGLLANDDDYGQFGLQMVKQELVSRGACVAFMENILTGQPNRNAPHLVRVIKESKAKVVVVVTFDSDFMIVLEEMLRQNITEHTWVASESWATSSLLSDEKFKIILLGTIGFAIHGSKMPTFSTHLSMLHPSKYLYDTFVMEFWEQVFDCKRMTKDNLVVLVENTTKLDCTGNENLYRLLFEEDQRLSLNVYTAVYAIAWGLHNLVHCSPRDGPFQRGICANISSFQPWQLLYYIKNVTFVNKDGSQMLFDAKGNPPAIYDVVNWYLNENGTLKQVKVGSYDLSNANGTALNVDDPRIVWINNEKQVPLSKCSPSCLSGFRKVIVPGKPHCCYECAQCPQGQISNQTDAVECYPCSWDTWPNIQQDRCVPKTTEFLSYDDSLGCGLAVIATCSSLIPLTILIVFVFHHKTPIVRANNYSLSCLLLVSLFLCFLSSLGFIGYPQPEKCLLRQVAFGIVFDLCISCVLAKTMIVIIAFNVTRPDSRFKKWKCVRLSYVIILFCVSAQICLCVVWLTLSPPFNERDMFTKPGVIIIICNESSPSAFWCMLGYLGLLATISFIVAFLARRLPNSFNEANYITFSMLAFLSVWVSFIPAYLSARGKYSVAMEVFAILSSTWAVVVCIFVPKCFIILFRPNMNSREHLTFKGQGHQSH